MIPQVKYNPALTPAENIMAWQNVINQALRDVYVGRLHEDKIQTDKQILDIQAAVIETGCNRNLNLSE